MHTYKYNQIDLIKYFTAHAIIIELHEFQKPLVHRIPDLGEAPMEAAILVHVHPLSPSFRPGGGQALPLSL